MNWIKIVYKTHKWLAVGAGLFAFLWFLSGNVMMLPSPLLAPAKAPSADSPPREPSPSFREVKVGLPEATATAEQATGRSVEVSSVRFRRLGTRLVYEIATPNSGRHLIDALDAKCVIVTENMAREIAAQHLGSRPALREVALLGSYDRNYAMGLLPVYRLVFENAEANIVYVSVETGEAYVTSRRSRLRAFVAGTHTFDFLRPFFRDRWVRFILLTLSGIGLLMSVFVGWILLLQFSGWWRARRGAA